ncbi:hypothetical protein BHM03_00052976 [Ensete ventricosum]|nr:hypothetical protein BHM03_00052976 [Ensete ventricosum]
MKRENYNKRFGQSQVQASGRSEDNAVGNSRGVHQELAEGIGRLPEWRKGVHQKKTETHRKIVRVSRNIYRELGRFRRYSGSSPGVR